LIPEVNQVDFANKTNPFVIYAEMPRILFKDTANRNNDKNSFDVLEMSIILYSLIVFNKN